MILAGVAIITILICICKVGLGDTATKCEMILLGTMCIKNGDEIPQTRSVA